MTDFLINTTIFYVLVIVFLGYMLVNARIKLGSFEQAINHYKNTENGSLTGIVLAAVVFPIVMALGIKLAYMFIGEASAEEFRYLQYTQIYAGLEHSQKLSPACYEGGVNDRLSSNLGLRQHLIGYKDIDVLGQYHHMSCATNRDREGTDALGLTVTWTFKR